MTHRNGSRLRITFVLAHANLSGGVRVVATYADRLRRRGHLVTVISTPRHPLSFRRRLAALAAGRGRTADGLGEPSHVDGVNVDHRVVRTWRPVEDADVPDADVVIATWWETAPWVRDLSPRKGAKLYFMQDYGLAPGQPIGKIIETWTWGLRIITISRFLRDLIRRHAPQPVETIPNAVDTDLFDAPPRDRHRTPTVGFLYSRNPLKGTDTCLRAIELARRRLPSLRVLAFGPAPPHPDLPLPDGCPYRAGVPDADLPSLYASCDAWLFATQREGFGLPILEAMACRTPVIATPAGAAPDLIEHGGGVLVPTDDAHAMADSIVGFATMPARQWRSMSARAHETAHAWTWEDATDRFESVLRVVAARPSDSTTLRVPA